MLTVVVGICNKICELKDPPKPSHRAFSPFPFSEIFRIFRVFVQQTSSGRGESKGCNFFAYSWKLPAYSGAFLLTIDNSAFFTYNWSLFAYSFSFFTYSSSFFAYNGKVRLIRALRDCNQRNFTISKKAPTVSKKASPKSKG